MGANSRAVGLCGFAIALSAPLLVPQAFAQQRVPADDPTRALVGRLDLEKYKATLKGLAQFGDRQEGTERNRKAVDWIEAQLKSYGCADIERLKYVFEGRGLARGPGPTTGPSSTVASGEVRPGLGGARIRGVTLPVFPNNDLNAQTDPALRALNAEVSTPGPREEVYCTKVGATHPEEMYIVGAHMDGLGFGEAMDDDGLGT